MNIQREGWLGDEYVRVYAANERSRIAQLYDFGTFLPGYELWGSWGFDALCLGRDSKLYVVDWIPLHEGFRRERYPNVEAFTADLSHLHDATSAYEHFQKEVHLMTPIVFGGNPSEKPVMIDQAAHAEVCRFWNSTYVRIKNVGQPGDRANAG